MAKPFPCQMANFFQICKWTFFPISTFAIIEEMTTSRRCLQCIIRAKLASQNHFFQQNWDQYEVDWNPRSNDIKLPDRLKFGKELNGQEICLVWFWFQQLCLSFLVH